MIISSKYKLIFVHIPKNGGTSVRRALEPISQNRIAFSIVDKLDHLLRLKTPGGRNVLYFRNALDLIMRILPLRMQVPRFHQSLSSLDNMKIEGYTVLFIYRKPLDRLWSIYRHEKRLSHSDLHVYTHNGFDSFVRIVLTNRWIDTVDCYISTMNDVRFFPIRFDNIDNDFDFFLREFGINPSAIGRLPHANRGEKLPSERLSSDTLSLVSEYFKGEKEVMSTLDRQ